MDDLGPDDWTESSKSASTSRQAGSAVVGFLPDGDWDLSPHWAPCRRTSGKPETSGANHWDLGISWKKPENTLDKYHNYLYNWWCWNELKIIDFLYCILFPALSWIANFESATSFNPAGVRWTCDFFPKKDRRTKVHQPIRKKILGWSCSLVFPPVFLVKCPFRLTKISTFAGDMGDISHSFSHLIALSCQGPPVSGQELPKHPAFWDLDVHQASLSSGLLLCNASPAWAGNAAPRIAAEDHGTGYCHHLVTLGR